MRLIDWACMNSRRFTWTQVVFGAVCAACVAGDMAAGRWVEAGIGTFASLFLWRTLVWVRRGIKHGESSNEV